MLSITVPEGDMTCTRGRSPRPRMRTVDRGEAWVVSDQQRPWAAEEERLWLRVRSEPVSRGSA